MHVIAEDNVVSDHCFLVNKTIVADGAIHASGDVVAEERIAETCAPAQRAAGPYWREIGTVF